MRRDRNKNASVSGWRRAKTYLGVVGTSLNEKFNCDNRMRLLLEIFGETRL